MTVTAPTIGGPGQVVTINYTVTNLSAGATFTDSWVDSIYLSLDDTLDSSDRLIGRTPHTGVVAGNGGSYAGSLTAPLPAVVPGDYRVIVVADSQGRTPDLNRANNTEHAPGLIAMDIPLLTDGVAVNGTIADGQSVFYRVNLPGAATRSFFANLVTKGQAELFVRYADTPLPDHSDGYAFSTSVEDARVLLPNGPAGTYYIELRGRSAAGAGSSFSLLAETLGFTVLGLDRTKAQNLGDVTVEIDGSRFTTDTAFDLVSPTGQAIHSSALFFAGGAKVFATFHLTGAATGLYDVRAMDGVAVKTLDDALLVQNGGRAGDLEFRLDVPRYIRPNGRVGIATIEYYNAGDSDIPAQLLLLSGADTYFRLPGEQSFKSDGLQFFATNDKGLAGVLPPGAHVTLQVEFLPKSFEPHALTDITLTQYLDSAPMNWDDLSASLRPVGTSDAAWAVVLANFKAHVGNTAGALNAAASQDLNYLSTIGNAPRDLDEVLKFETLLADNYGEISARFKGGAFGLGQADPNEFKARTLPGGVVRVRELDSFITFVLETGNYRNITGDGSMLATSGSNLLLTKSDGTKVTLDKTTGRLKSIQQVSGDTLTASYNAAGLLSDYTLSTGDTIHITYNGAGLATALDGPGTRHTGFTYTDGRLTSRIEAGGTTAYTYVTTAGSAAINALASITFADGTSRSFSYDTIGRTASVTQPGGHHELYLSRPGAVESSHAHWR